MRRVFGRLLGVSTPLTGERFIAQGYLAKAGRLLRSAKKMGARVALITFCEEHLVTAV